MKRAGLDTQKIKALPQYNDLLKYLRGNPLAIQAILPELKRTTPDALLSSLQTGGAKLSDDDPAQGRERTLSASLTYRLDALDATLRQRLGVLALFQGFVDADVLAHMCQQVDGVPDTIKGLGRDEWIRMLNTAAEVGLLRSVGDGYYTVHPALPWFFHDLLREAFPDYLDWLEKAFSAAYSEYASYLDETFKTNAEFAMSLLRAEENNLIYALHLARRHELWGYVDGILYGFRTLFVTQGRWVEWEKLINEIEAEITDADGKPLSKRENLWLFLLGHRSEIAHYRRDFDEVEHIQLLGKAHFETQGDDRNLAAAIHQLGIIAQERRQFDEAERWYRQSLEIKGRIGDEHGQASTLHQLGRVAQERRQFDEAAHWYQQSLAIRERIGDEHGQAGTLHQLGRVAQLRRQLDEAERWYRQSLSIQERIGDERVQAAILHSLGDIAQLRRQLDEAERWYRQSLAINERIGDEHGQAGTLHQLGMIAQERRQFDEAERWYRQSLAINERIGDEDRQASTLHQLGMVAQERRRFDEAERWYRQSLEIKGRIGNEHGQAGTLHQLGSIAEEQGNLPEAIRFYEQAEALFARLNDDYYLEGVRSSLKRVRDNEQG